jgi:hypothetical protein
VIQKVGQWREKRGDAVAASGAFLAANVIQKVGQWRMSASGTALQLLAALREE